MLRSTGVVVAAAGTAPVNRVQILRNVLKGQSLQMVIRNGKRHYRDDWTIVGNTSDATVGNPLGAAMRIRNVDGLEIADNFQRFQKGRKMVLASIYYSCHVSVHGNQVPGSVGVTRSTRNCCTARARLAAFAADPPDALAQNQPRSPTE